MKALAVIGGTSPVRKQSQTIKLKSFSLNAIFSGELKERAETKAALEMIDWP